MIHALNLLAQTKIDADRALDHAADFDSLTYVLVVFMFLGAALASSFGGILLWKGILPWLSAKVRREDNEADVRNEAMTTMGEATRTIAGAITRHDERFNNHDKRFDHLDKAVGAVHERLDRFCGNPRRLDDPSQPPLPRA